MAKKSRSKFCECKGVSRSNCRMLPGFVAKKGGGCPVPVKAKPVAKKAKKKVVTVRKPRLSKKQKEMLQLEKEFRVGSGRRFAPAPQRDEWTTKPSMPEDYNPGAMAAWQQDAMFNGFGRARRMRKPLRRRWF